MLSELQNSMWLLSYIDHSQEITALQVLREKMYFFSEAQRYESKI